IPGFEDQLIGKKAGDNVDVKVPFPKDYHAKDLAGKEALFKTTIKEIREKHLPEIDDKLAEELGQKNLEELKKYIKEHLAANYNQATRSKMKQALLDALADMKLKDFETPESL